MIEDTAKTSQDSPRRDESQIEGQDSGTVVFDSFRPATWLEYSKMLDAHERAAWLEGYKCAKNEVRNHYCKRLQKPCEHYIFLVRCYI